MQQFSPTIAMVHSNATGFWFRPYTVCALPMTKGNCTLKCIQLCVLIFFSWHIFPPKVQPWSNHDAAESRPSCTHVCLLCTDWSSLSFYSGIIWSKEECRNQPDLLFLFDWAFAKGTREMFLLARGGISGIFEVAVRLFGALNGLVTEKTRCIAHYRGELSFRLNFYERPKALSLKLTQGSWLSAR